MITDTQWNIFKQHIKPNSTVRCEGREGFLIENFPYHLELDRISLEGFYFEQNISHHFTEEGRVKVMGSGDFLLVQLCDSLEDTEAHCRWDLDYWLHGDFLTFDQIIALGAP